MTVLARTPRQVYRVYDEHDFLAGRDLLGQAHEMCGGARAWDGSSAETGARRPPRLALAAMLVGTLAALAVLVVTGAGPTALARRHGLAGAAGRETAELAPAPRLWRTRVGSTPPTDGTRRSRAPYVAAVAHPRPAAGRQAPAPATVPAPVAPAGNPHAPDAGAAAGAGPSLAPAAYTADAADVPTPAPAAGAPPSPAPGAAAPTAKPAIQSRAEFGFER